MQNLWYFISAGNLNTQYPVGPNIHRLELGTAACGEEMKLAVLQRDIERTRPQTVTCTLIEFST
jgi:hypothetical protein